MDIEEIEQAQQLAIEYDLQIDPEDEDDLQLILDADYDSVNLENVATILSDSGISDLYTAIELVRDNSVMTKEDLLDGWVEMSGIDGNYIIYLDMDQIWQDVFEHGSNLCEMNDGTYIEIP